MQVGIFSQLKERGDKIKAQVIRCYKHHGKQVRVFFCRHMSLPLEVAGVFQLCMAMAWQRVNKVSDVNPFLRDSPDFN